MVCTKKAQVPICNLMVNGNRIEQKGSFKYLGTWIPSDERSNKGVLYRIGLAKQTFKDLENIICSHRTGMTVKERLYITAISGQP